jgi:hypothetical protein
MRGADCGIGYALMITVMASWRHGEDMRRIDMRRIEGRSHAAHHVEDALSARSCRRRAFSTIMSKTRLSVNEIDHHGGAGAMETKQDAAAAGGGDEAAIRSGTQALDGH